MRGWLRRVVWSLLPCRHVDVAGHSVMYRERRALEGRGGQTLVMHLVCDRCGHQQPMVDRSLKDHRRVVAISTASARMQARPVTADVAGDVVEFEARRRAPRRSGGGLA